MCGRTCLTLEPAQIARACKYKCTEHKTAAAAAAEETKQIDENLPVWRAEHNFGRTFTPSHNLAPTDITPVLVSGDYFCDAEQRLLVPMMWGMIPFWHKGKDYRNHGLSTNNCRLEHLLESKLYRGPFQRGQRCVVLAEGFYEWQTTKSAKPSERAAYYLYMPQADDLKIYDAKSWSSADDVKLLKMAALFDVWQNENGEKMLSYSVITFEANKLTNWLHHRMPAILENEQQVNDWLDYKRVPADAALKLLRPATALAWHQVSNMVNNSRNKSDQCNKPISLAQTPLKRMSKTMENWLNIRKRREQQTEQAISSSDDELLPDNNSYTTSEDEQPAKRPCYKHFKKSANK